jgi:hypothetical protein
MVVAQSLRVARLVVLAAPGYAQQAQEGAPAKHGAAAKPAAVGTTAALEPKAPAAR